MSISFDFFSKLFTQLCAPVWGLSNCSLTELFEHYPWKLIEIHRVREMTTFALSRRHTKIVTKTNSHASHSIFTFFRCCEAQFVYLLRGHNMVAQVRWNTLCCSNGKEGRFSCFWRIRPIFDQVYLHQFWLVFQTFQRILRPCVRSIRITIDRCVWNITHGAPQDEVKLRLTKVLKNFIPIGKVHVCEGKNKVSITFSPLRIFMVWPLGHLRAYRDSYAWKLEQ